jgi:DNA sulfur modification protein DndD
MIIQELTLQNFMCYYDIKTFKFSKGVNLILGHNGDGKTTIFLAFKWLFDQQFNLSENIIFSDKRFKETTTGESFKVSVSAKVSQYNQIYILEREFKVINKNEEAITTETREHIYFVDKNKGNANLIKENFSQVVNMVFPQEFRNFSVFETERETLNLVEGHQLYKLVQLFSDAKSYEKLKQISEAISEKAERAYTSECKANKTIMDEISKIDKSISEKEVEISNYLNDIAEDSRGESKLETAISELAKNSGISKQLNELNSKINSNYDQIRQLESSIKEEYTDYLFDDYYILMSYKDIKKNFSKKIDDFRQKKNKKRNELEAAYNTDKTNRLILKNGKTPLPPGSPTEKILEEFLADNVCKICGRTLDEESVGYINKSLELYRKTQIDHSWEETPIFFPNTFISELDVLDQVLDNLISSLSIYDVNKEISELIDFNASRLKDIDKIKKQLEPLEQEKRDLLNSAPSCDEDSIVNVVAKMKEYSDRLGKIKTQIGRSKTLLNDSEQDLKELKISKTKILAQTQEGNFKRNTVDTLSLIASIFSSTEKREYKRYLGILEKKATNYLKEINSGEITGTIKLQKTDDEIIYKTVNDDGTERSELKDSGALTISLPMSLLFAISDLASEVREDNLYPMIFDAPTARFSPDREIAFFNALHTSGKQRIIVTLRFLDVDLNKNPFVNKTTLSKIPYDKAFWIHRERPIVEGNTNTIIEEL